MARKFPTHTHSYWAEQQNINRTTSNFVSPSSWLDLYISLPQSIPLSATLCLDAKNFFFNWVRTLCSGVVGFFGPMLACDFLELRLSNRRFVIAIAAAIFSMTDTAVAGRYVLWVSKCDRAQKRILAKKNSRKSGCHHHSPW